VEEHRPSGKVSRYAILVGVALAVGACGGGSNDTGTGGTQAAGGHGGSSPGTGGSAGTGTAGTTGGGGGGTTGSAGTGGSATGGTTGTGGSGAAGTGGSGTGGSAAGTGGGAGGATAGATGTGGGAAGRGGQGGGNAGAGGGNAGHGGAGGTAGGGAGDGGHGGASGGSGAGGTAGGGGSGTVDAGVQDGATMSNGAFVRTAWTATYTCTGTCPAQSAADTGDVDTKQAFDGNRGTRWSTGQYQQSSALMSKFPLYFTVDMKEVVNISRITLDAGSKDSYDAPGEMDVLVSPDGTAYTTIVANHKPVSPMTGATDDIMFTRTQARYIQLKATMTIKQVNSSLGDRYWAIGEMNVYP
jgi:hypothetical protein